MSYNYTVKYRTFDELLNDVLVDFQNLTLENMIEPQQLIKVAKRVNYDLGLRIMMTKEALLEVEHGRVRLPDDFFTLNFALICDNVTVQQPISQGTNIQEIPFVPQYQETPAVINSCTNGPVNCVQCQQPTPCGCGCAAPAIPTACTAPETNYNPLVPFGNSCVKPRVFMNCKGDQYELIQIVKSQTFSYRRLLPLKILENPETIDCGCPNLYMNSAEQGWIRGDFLYTTFKHGKVYINYQGMMEDDQGNLLVVNHDMINEVYEYALKKRILENLVMNDEPVSQLKLQMVEAGYKTARNYALSIVNTPNFSEMKRMFDVNRKAQYAKYYDMFKSYPSYTGYRNQTRNMEGNGPW